MIYEVIDGNEFMQLAIIPCMVFLVIGGTTLWNYYVKNRKDFYAYLFVYAGCAFLFTLIKALFHKSMNPFYDIFLPLFINVCFAVIWYDIILICILPILRKHFPASVCAYLWLLPNSLYWLFYFSNLSENYGEFIPSFAVVYIPKRVMIAIMIVWLLGFALVFAKIMVEDYVFRKELQNNSYPVKDSETLSIFHILKHDFDEKDQIQLRISPIINTPLSIGQNPEKMIVFLPERNYTEDELIWIFKHELTHLEKNDCGLKMFVSVTTAIFWFIPMSWIMKKRLTEDQELSCDASVTEGYSSERRLEYARVVLGSAGDGRGFSTCLSATGKSLRYRLANVVHPRDNSDKKSYRLFLLCILFLFVMCNLIEFSTNGGKMSEVLHTDTFQIKENAEEWQEYFENSDIVETKYVFYGRHYLGHLEVDDQKEKSSINEIEFYGDVIAVYDSDIGFTYYKVNNTSYKELLKDNE